MSEREKERVRERESERESERERVRERESERERGEIGGRDGIRVRDIVIVCVESTDAETFRPMEHLPQFLQHSVTITAEGRNHTEK